MSKAEDYKKYKEEDGVAQAYVHNAEKAVEGKTPPTLTADEKKRLTLAIQNAEKHGHEYVPLPPLIWVKGWSGPLDASSVCNVAFWADD